MTNSPIEGLQVSLASYKALVSDYALRARQAEAMVATLMQKNIPPEVFATQVVNKVMQDVETRELERSTQYRGVIQTTIMSLTNLRLSNPDRETYDDCVLEIIKALTVAVSPPT